MARYLVVGSDGALGEALVSRLLGLGHDVVGTSRRAGAAHVLDLEGSDWVLPTDVDGAWLMAGVTQQARCTADPAGTRRVNVDATVTLAERLVRAGAFVVFPSTNVVFDGETPHAAAGAERRPANEYGRQKRAAEDALRPLGAAIVRLTKVLHRQTPLVAHWRDELAAGRRVRAFDDMVMAPVSLARATEALVWAGTERRAGVHHLSADRDIPYAEAARRLARRWGSPEGVDVCSWRDDPRVTSAPPRHTCLAPTPPLACPDADEALAEAAT